MAEQDLSKRGQRARDFPDFMGKYGDMTLGNRYHAEDNPEGIVNLGVAENTLSEDILTKKMNSPEMNTYESYMQYYFEFRGLRSFREALATFLGERFNSARPIDPDHLIVTSGVGAAIDLLAYMNCDPGDCCLVFAPYYAAISADVGIRAQLVCIPVQLSSSTNHGQDAFEVDIEETEKTIIRSKAEGKKIRCAIVINPHNPTGDILSRDKLLALLKLFNKYEMHVVMDEIYALSLLGDHCFTSVLSLETVPCPEKTHFVWGFGKDFGLSGFRCGVIHSLQRNLALAATQLLYLAAVPPIIQNKLTTLIQDKEWLDGEYFPQNRRGLKESYEYSKQRLEEMGADVHTPKAALFLLANLRKFLQAPTAEEEMSLFEEILSAKVFCVPGTAMFYNEPGWYRFIFSHNQTLLKVGYDRLEEVLKKRSAIYFTNTCKQNKI